MEKVPILILSISIRKSSRKSLYLTLSVPQTPQTLPCPSHQWIHGPTSQDLTCFTKLLYFYQVTSSLSQFFRILKVRVMVSASFCFASQHKKKFMLTTKKNGSSTLSASQLFILAQYLASTQPSTEPSKLRLVYLSIYWMQGRN